MQIDDTILTIAIAEAIQTDKNYEKALKPTYLNAYYKDGLVLQTYKESIHGDLTSSRIYLLESGKYTDYNTMREVIYRRYFRVLKDNLDRPDLIIVDGGENHFLPLHMM